MTLVIIYIQILKGEPRPGPAATSGAAPGPAAAASASVPGKQSESLCHWQCPGRPGPSQADGSSALRLQPEAAGHSDTVNLTPALESVALGPGH